MRKFTALSAAVSIAAAMIPAVMAANVSYMADFETAETKFGKSTTYSGFKNTALDYNDYIKPAWIADGGKDGSTGLEITYQSATWYAGEIFMPIPAVWQNGEGAEYLNFDYKGKGIVKISLSTGSNDAGTLTSGTRYTYRFDADTNGEWSSISIPLSEFVNGTTPVTVTEIGAITFQAGENANLSNSADTTKGMSAAELTAVAKTGDIIFDNMELSDEGTYEPAPTGTEANTPPAATQEVSTAIIDFDAYSLSRKQTWAGFQNNAGDYSDFIKSELTENGKDGNGFKLSYQAATWYSGEVFCAVPKDWAITKPAQYLEFDAKGDGVFKIGLETGEVINGTRYEARVDIDTNGEWKKYSIPLSSFVNGTTPVTLSEVIGMTFKSAESGNLSNSAAETKAMSYDELMAAALTGEAVIDNITLSETYNAVPAVNVTAGAADEGTGKRSCKVTLSNCSIEQPVTVVIALYDSGGALVSARTKTETISVSGDIYFDTTPGENTLKIFVLDSLDSLKPFCEISEYK